jgi:hypothetical protein
VGADMGVGMDQAPGVAMQIAAEKLVWG